MYIKYLINKYTWSKSTALPKIHLRIWSPYAVKSLHIIPQTHFGCTVSNWFFENKLTPTSFIYENTDSSKGKLKRICYQCIIETLPPGLSSLSSFQICPFTIIHTSYDCDYKWMKGQHRGDNTYTIDCHVQCLIY